MEQNFSHQVTIAFSDTDMAGVVHFAKFFLYMEETEEAFYRSFGRTTLWEEAGKRFGLPKVHVECAYLSPLHYHDILEVDLLVESVEERSLTYTFAFWKNRKKTPKLCAQGKMKVVCAEIRGPKQPMKAIDIPSSLRNALERAMLPQKPVL